VIVKEDDVEFDAFLQRGDDFLGHHQIGAVADHHVDFSLGVGHFCAEAAGNFVAHAGIAVFHVVAAGLAGAPEFVQIARKAAGGAKEDVGGFGEGVEGADDFALREGRSFTRRVDAIDFFFPVGAECGDAGSVVFFDLVASGGGLEFF